MQHRTLTRPQQLAQEVDPYGLQAFQDEVITEFKLIQQGFDRQRHDIGNLQGKLNHLQTMLTWIGEHRPEAIIDFNTTHDVISRLEDSAEKMEKEA